MTEFYDRNGNPISLETWVGKDNSYRSIAYTELPSGKRVSTVWLGLNYNYFSDDPPLIFETMVFSDDSFLDLDCKRYTTEEEATQGHKEMVEKWTER